MTSLRDGCEVGGVNVVTMVFGSHLYGTDTPTSDRDYKGVFLPSKRSLYLGMIPKSITLSKGSDQTKNTPLDTDFEVYSLHYFLKLAKEGQTVALDMLHADPQCWTHSSPLWKDLVSKRQWFYTKNLEAFVGYARTQAAKYGIKGSRLSTAKEVLEFLQKHGSTRMAEIWPLLWENEHCHLLHNGTHRIWKVCGKGISETTRCDLGAEMIQNYVDRYGERAKLAARNEGIDWKAVSHALRAGYQARAIFETGTFEFPLLETPFLRDVKSGSLDYPSIVGPELERLMEQLEQLRTSSFLPETVDEERIDNWLVESLEYVYVS